MRTIVAALGIVLALSGCLTTKQPVFDESNSLPVAEIPEFMAAVEAWEAYHGTDGSPREMIAQNLRGIAVDGFAVVQENSDYFAFAVIGNRPVFCAIYAEEGIAVAAKSQGVSVEVDWPDEERWRDLPVPVTADGPKEALMAFIRDQFANQRLACLAQAKRTG